MAVKGPILPLQAPPQRKNVTAYFDATAEKVSFVAEHVITYNGSLWKFSRKFSAKDAKERGYFQREFTREIAQNGRHLLERLKNTGILEQPGFRILPPRSEKEASFQIKVQNAERPINVLDDPEEKLVPHLFKLSGPLVLHKETPLRTATPPSTKKTPPQKKIIATQPPLFKNYLNSCHFNSAMSLIARNDRIRKLILQHSKKPLLVQALRQYKTTPRIDFQPLHKAIAASIPKDMVVGRQEDVHDTILAIINYAELPEDCDLNLGFKERTYYEARPNEPDDDPDSARAVPNRGFPEVSIPLPRSELSLQDLVDNALYTQNLPPSDPMRGLGIPKQKAMIFDKAPETLMIHLRRFEYVDPTTTNKRKDPVEVPMQLILSERAKFQTSETYTLESFSVHRGKSLEENGLENVAHKKYYAHYVTYFRKTDDGTYWCFDDLAQKNTYVSREEFLKQARSAYVLVYNRV